MNTDNHNNRIPLAEVVPPLPNGRPVADSPEISRTAGLNAKLVQENARLAQENAKLLQERNLMRMVIDNLPDFVYCKDKQGRFVLNNPAHARDLGVNSPEELKGKSDFDFFPPELAAQFYTDEQKIIETGEPVINQEQCNSKFGDPTGAKRWAVSSKVIWRDEQGVI